MFNKRNKIKICAVVLLAVCFLNFFAASAAPNFKRPLDSVYHVAYEKIMKRLYPFKCDETTLGILSDFYEELVNANIRLDTEFYPAEYANRHATDVKKIIELVVKESRNYSGSETHMAVEILTLAEKILPELEISIAKINGYAPGTNTEPGFHNFDFSKPGILFSDVPPDSWYAADVAKVSGSGIMQGTGNNKYEPDKVLTKAEATILFAKLNAIYYGREAELQKFLSNPKDHWASGVLDYCAKYNLPFLRPFEFDLPCQRQEMAMLIMNAFPKDNYATVESAYKVINSAFEFKEDPEELCARLFLAGIFMGDTSGLNPLGHLTRSQAAALTYRAACPSARIKLREQFYIPADLISVYPSQHCVVGSNGPGYASKPVFKIKGTVWNPGAIDFTGNLDTSGKDSYNKYLRYGNHRYFSYNEEQYNFVVNTALEAFEFANNPQNITIRDYITTLPTFARGIEGNIYDNNLFIAKYLNGECTYEEMVKKYTNPSTEKLIEALNKYKVTYNITSPTDIVNLLRIFETVSIMRNYFRFVADENRIPNAREFSSHYVDEYGQTQYQDNEVYYYLTKGLNMDCDGEASVSMLIWDTLGFSTRMNSSRYCEHGGAEVYLGGKWMTLTENALPDCTHEELIEDISIYKSVKSHNLAGIFADRFAIDLRVDLPPTHNPQDFRFDTPIPLNN